MPISLSKDAQAIVDTAVDSGSFPTPEAVVEASLLLLAEREKKLAWLRNKIRRAIARGGSHTMEEADRKVEATLDAWERDRNGAAKAAE